MPKDIDKNVRKPQPQMTKRQVSRFERERRLQRIALAACAFIVALVIIIPAYGFWKESRRGDEAAATVNGVAISNTTYAKVVGFHQAEIDVMIANYENYLASASDPNQSEEAKDNAELIRQLFTQQIEQLQQERGNVELYALDELVNAELVRAEAARRNITVTPEEVDQYILDRFGPEPTTTGTEPGANSDEGTATETPTGTGTATPTPQPASTPTPTPGQAPLDVAKQNMSDMLNALRFLPEQEFRTLIVEPAILTAKVQKAIGDEVRTEAEQVHVRHILIEMDKEEEAKNALTKLQQGADFEAMAKELSADTSNKDNGGDLGWFPRGVMDPEFEKAAFEVQPGQLYGQLVKSSFGYHIIKGEGYEPSRPISEDILSTLRQKAYSDWLQQQRESANIEYSFSYDNLAWVRNYLAEFARSAK